MPDTIAIDFAREADLDMLKYLADENRDELGFIMREQLKKAILEKECLVGRSGAAIVGFAIFHIRKDAQCTLYSLCVGKDWQGQGFGRRLMEALERHAGQKGAKYIFLKCPLGLPANRFYKRLGYLPAGAEPSKRRMLIWYKKSISH
jgi:GNAT superfamily N-acetyltransferase